MASSRKSLLGECLLQGALLVALLVVAFPDAFFSGETIFPGDILFQTPPWSHYAPENWTGPQNPIMTDLLHAFHPWYLLSKQAVLRGEWPLWNHLELGGMPLLANYQSAAFYPPRLLHLFLDVPFATTIFILLKLWLCGMTGYICGRGLGLRPSAARFLSIGWMLAGYNMSWANWPLPDVSAWFPIVFLGTEWVLSGRYRKGVYALTAGATLILLAGHPESAFGMCFGLALYCLARLVWERPSGRVLRKTVGALAGAWMVALMASAAQLLPFIEYLGHRSHFAERFASGATLMAPVNMLIGLWVPRFFGSSVDFNFWGEVSSLRYTMVYPGIAVWFGIALLTVKPQRGARRTGRVVALLSAGAASLFLALEVVPRHLFAPVPALNAMMPHYHICFVLFVLPLLGAIGVDRWFARRRNLRELWPSLVLMAVVCLIVAGFAWFYGGLMAALGVARFAHGQILIAGALATITLAILAGCCLWPRKSLFSACLVFLLAADLLVAARGLNPTVPREHVFPDTALTDFLGSREKPCRMGLAEAGIISGVLAPYGIEDWLGFDGIYPERMLTFQRRLGPALWNVMEPVCAIQYYTHDPRYPPLFPLEKPGRFTRVAALDGIEVYKNNAAFPRAYLVPDWQTVPDKDRLFAVMREPTFDPRGVVPVLAADAPMQREEKAPKTDSLAAAHALGAAKVTRRRSTEVVIEAQSSRPCVLVLADAYYPGWKAWIDGVPAEIFAAYYAFRGVFLEPGAHEIVFRYAPASFQIGLAVSSITLFGIGVVALLFNVRQARSSR